MAREMASSHNLLSVILRFGLTKYEATVKLRLGTGYAAKAFKYLLIYRDDGWCMAACSDKGLRRVQLAHGEVLCMECLFGYKYIKVDLSYGGGGAGA
jgi:hypothetical protein